MTSIIFSLDKESDVKNRYTALYTSSYGVDWSSQIPNELIEKLIHKNEHEVREVLSPFLDKTYAELRLVDVVKELNSWWEKCWELLFKRMEKIVGKPIPVETINSTITTIWRCPYNPQKWSFMYMPFKRNKDIKAPQDSIKTTVHELLHMMLHYYYESYIKSKWLTNNEFHDLKEAQTVILNEEYGDILASLDVWYEIHQELRKKFAEFRKQNKDFLQFVDYWIMTVKSVIYEG